MKQREVRNPHFCLWHTHALATSQSGSRRLDTAYLQTTATPTGMQSAKLGQVTNTCAWLVSTNYLRVTDLQTNWLQYFAPTSGRSNKIQGADIRLLKDKILDRTRHVRMDYVVIQRCLFLKRRRRRCTGLLGIKRTMTYMTCIGVFTKAINT